MSYEHTNRRVSCLLPGKAPGTVSRPNSVMLCHTLLMDVWTPFHEASPRNWQPDGFNIHLPGGRCWTDGLLWFLHLFRSLVSRWKTHSRVLTDGSPVYGRVPFTASWCAFLATSAGALLQPTLTRICNSSVTHSRQPTFGSGVFKDMLNIRLW